MTRIKEYASRLVEATENRDGPEFIACFDALVIETGEVKDAEEFREAIEYLKVLTPNLNR